MFNIGLDVDGVLLNLESIVQKHIKKLYGKVQYKDNWCMKEKYSLNDDQLQLIWSLTFDDLYKLPSMRGSLDFLSNVDKVSEKDIYFISAIEEKYHNQRYENLLRNFSSIDFIKNEKFTLICTGEQSKRTSIIENNINLYVDDRLKNIYDVKDLELKKYYLNCNHFEPDYDIMLNELKLSDNFHIIDNLKELDLCSIMS